MADVRVLFTWVIMDGLNLLFAVRMAEGIWKDRIIMRHGRVVKDPTVRCGPKGETDLL